MIATIIIISIFLLIYSPIPTFYYKLKKRRIGGEGCPEKSVSITFDDGPEEGYTDVLLDLLKKYNIKAAFFVVAEKARQHPHLIERMKKEGHIIGLHSLEHKNAMIKGPAYTNYDFETSMDIMKELGVKIEYYRPPWGHFNVYTILNMIKYNLKPVLWNVMAGDWKANTTPELIERKLIRSTGNSLSILCLHDGRGKNQAPGKMITALKHVLPLWQDSGYEFLKVDEING